MEGDGEEGRPWWWRSAPPRRAAPPAKAELVFHPREASSPCGGGGPELGAGLV